LTVVTATAHWLDSGELVSLISNNSPQELLNQTVTVTNATTFTVANIKAIDFKNGNCLIGFLSTGQTGIFTFTAPRSGASMVVQSFVTGTGGATYELMASLDNVHWVALAAVVHPGTTDDTQFVSIEPAWAYIGINVSSIGTATDLTVLYCG
jgi:hypothetical protein